MFYAILIFGGILYTVYKLYEVCKEKERLEKEIEDAYNYARDQWNNFKAGFK